MQIVFRLHSFLILCSVLCLHELFLRFFLVDVIFMDFPAFLKRSILGDELGFGFYMFGLFQKISKFMCVFLFYGFGMKLLSSSRFVRVFIRFVCDWGQELKNGACSESVADGGNVGTTLRGKPIPDSDSLEKVEGCNPDEEYDNGGNNGDVDDGGAADNYTYEYSDSDVSSLRKSLKMEMHRANAILSELAKERAASASATAEAMAMILRLQNEKSLVELEWSQYKRLAEEKQIHDQEVIRSLQWLVWRHESERSLLEEQLKVCQKNMKPCSSVDRDEGPEARRSSFTGNIMDALENVLYSSRDANLLSP